MSFHLKSYELHSSSYISKDATADLQLYRNWFDNNSVDNWRHLRMLEGLNPFLKEYPGAKWLTVGDGRYGTSAIYINRNGGDALPTDIDISLLKVAKENNIIGDYREENAEQLTFGDESFDFVFCKEAYHHFPRPYIALYEMLRCAKSAIIFSEPNDFLPAPIPRRILQMVKHRIKKIFGLEIHHSDTGHFEPIGNYVFSISKREFQKIAIAMNLPMVAFKEFNDIYYQGVETEKFGENGKLFRKIKRDLAVKEIKFNFGLDMHNRITAVIFKKEPSASLRDKMKEAGFNLISLPKNPYVQPVQ